MVYQSGAFTTGIILFAAPSIVDSSKASHVDEGMDGEKVERDLYWKSAGKVSLAPLVTARVRAGGENTWMLLGREFKCI
jgi:hypothetical protein